jgi:hypothetical protein
LAKWNDEIFSHHNKSITNAADEEGETIQLDDDAEEIARDMEGLHLGDTLDPESETLDLADWNINEMVNIFSVLEINNT